MKSKFIFAAFVAALFSVAVFADGAAATTAINKKVTSKGSGSNLNSRTNSLEKQVRLLQGKVDAMQKREKYTGYDIDSLVGLYAHGPAVVTSPAFGVRRSAEDASDLMVSLSSINEDLLLLQTRQKMDNYAFENKIPIPERPIIALSGSVEGRVDYRNHNKFTSSADGSDINLSRAELDVIGEASPWATAAMIISYDDVRPDAGVRTSHSRFRLDRGFLTIGQLNKFPLYATIGQVFAPFGSFSSYMITSSSPKILGRFKDRMVIAGYSKDGIQAQVYGFAGETKKGATSNNIFGHSGFNLLYDYEKDKFKFKVGGSILGNLAESDGMQYKIFQNNESINSRVYGIDGRVKISYDAFTVLAEYIGAGKPFNVNDMSFNNAGAKPQALNVEGAVEFQIAGKPNTFAVGYGQTWQALALSLPKNTFFTSYEVSFLKNTIFSVEYRHDINYGWNDVANGGGSSVAKPVTAVSVVQSMGQRHSNTVTAQIGVYF